jgi:hypothetical protein
MPLEDQSDMNPDPTPTVRRFNLNELDYTLDYSGQMDMIGYSAGFILYTFPVVSGSGGNAAVATTQELYISLGIDTLLSPSVTFYRDVRANNGWYINGGISQSIPLIEEGDVPISVDLSASLGWGDSKYNNGYWTLLPGSPPGGGLNDLAVSAAIPLDVAGISIVPSISYVTLVENKVRANNIFTNGTKDDFLFVGVGVSKEF